MIVLVRILMVLVIVEVIAGGVYLALRPGVASAIVPEVELFDPLIMPELQQLADRAEQSGGSAWREFAEGLLGKGFYTHAEQAFREAVRVNPGDVEARFGLAFCLDRTGRLDESAVVYHEVIGLPAKSATQEILKHYALYALGRNALRKENPRQAEKYFNSDLDYAPAAYQLANLLIREGRTEEALPLIEHMLDQIPYSLEFHFLNYRAQRELNNDRAAEAAAAMIDRSAYLVSMNFNTEYVEQFNNRVGLIQLSQQVTEAEFAQDWPEMESLCRKIEALAGENLPYEQGHIINDLLLTAERQKRPDEMLTAIEKWKQAGQLNARLLDYEGDAYYQKEEFDKAAAAWERALTLSPTQLLYQKLGDYYRSINNAERSREYLARARWLEGVAAYRRNQLEVALISFEQASQLDPQFAAPWFYQGEMHYFLENKSAAIAAYRKCLNLAPGWGRAAERIRFLDKTSGKSSH